MSQSGSRMLIEDLHREAQDDLSLSPENVRNAALYMPMLKVKWLRYFYEISEKLEEINGKYNSLYKSTWVKIKKNSQLAMDKRDLEKAVLADPDIITARKIVGEYEHRLAFIEAVIKSFDGINFAISNYIKVKAFEEGS